MILKWSNPIFIVCYVKSVCLPFIHPCEERTANIFNASISAIIYCRIALCLVQGGVASFARILSRCKIWWLMVSWVKSWTISEKMWVQAVIRSRFVWMGHTSYLTRTGSVSAKKVFFFQWWFVCETSQDRGKSYWNYRYFGRWWRLDTLDTVSMRPNLSAHTHPW